MPLPDWPTTDLEAEQQHLTESREQLGRMRERTAADGRVGRRRLGQPRVPRSAFALRMKQLADDPTIPLFFGRLDYADGSATSTSGGGTSATSTATRW